MDQANQEMVNRFDFRSIDARIERSELLLMPEGQNQSQLAQMLDVLHRRLVRRGMDMGSLEKGKAPESGYRARQALEVRQGSDKELPGGC